MTSAPHVIKNATIVLPDRVTEGWAALADGQIAEVGDGQPPRDAEDWYGDYLLPGLVELHTDHLETHLRPRPRVKWPVQSALLAFDAQVAASGITTVFDCVRVGNDEDYDAEGSDAATVARTILDAQDEGHLRADHHIHLRCEVCADDVLDDLERVLATARADLISLMDHTPGARQFVNLDSWRVYYGGKAGLTDAQMDALILTKKAQFDRNYDRHRGALVTEAKRHGIVLASHDDATAAHVDEAIKDGVGLAEFPTTVEAARASHDAGIHVMMGAPNVVRGGSHSGNIAAETLARAKTLDVLSSDYVPASLMLGAFDLVRRIEGYPLADAIALVTRNPAQAAGLGDRGEISAGKRADVVRVQLSDGHPIVREVYREGRRVV
ncbi:MAG: alpha-D-ribose 1-methylphosphonate 5-triphosphate diphosphatase [Pseudomonadota bacterium]